jgi:hypothetical protein
MDKFGRSLRSVRSDKEIYRKIHRGTKEFEEKKRSLRRDRGF